MSQKHPPRHRRAYSKEFQTALRVIAYLKTGRILLPTPVDLETGKLADVIGLGMGTVKPDDIPPPEVHDPDDDEDLRRLIGD